MAWVVKQDRYKLEKVDVVPDDYYGITEILSSNFIHESPENIKKWREQTLKNVIAAMKEADKLDIIRWWREHITHPDVLVTYSSDFIWLMKNTYLARAIKLVEIFVEERRPKNVNASRFYVSWGIKKEYFKIFFESGGKEIPRLRVEGQNGTSIPEGSHTVKEGLPDTEEQNFISRDAVFKRWKDWCRLKGYKMKYAASEALRMQIENEPDDRLPPEIEYMSKQPPVVTDKRPVKGIDRVTCRIMRPQMLVAKDIVAAYNARHLYDIEGPMSETRYVSMAVEMLNNIMGKEYLNQQEELDDMQEKIDKMDEQINQLMKKM